MSYVFSFAEREKIVGVASLCAGLQRNTDNLSYEARRTIGANCAPLYEVLSDILQERLDGRYKFDDRVVDGFRSAKLWLDVAFDANGGAGAYSA
ncbi:hypothetical protein D3C71_695650 [compost metagenome]